MNLWQGLAAAGVGLLKGQNIVQERKRAEKERQEDKDERAKREDKAAAVDQLRVYDNSITALANNGELDKAREVLRQRNALADEHKLPQLPEDLTKPNRRLQYDDWLKFKNQFGNTQDGYKAAKRAFGGLWGEEEAETWFPEAPGPQTVQPSVGMAGKFLPPSRPGQGLLPIPKADATPTPVPPAQAAPQAAAPNFNPFLEKMLQGLPQPVPAPAPTVMGAMGGPPPVQQPLAAPTPTLPAPAPISPQVGVAGASSIMEPPGSGKISWTRILSDMLPQPNLGLQAKAKAAMDAWQYKTPEQRELDRLLAEKDTANKNELLRDLILQGPRYGYNMNTITALMKMFSGEPVTPEDEAAVENVARIFSDYKGSLTGLHTQQAANTAMKTKYIGPEFELKEKDFQHRWATAQANTDIKRKSLELNKLSEERRATNDAVRNKLLEQANQLRRQGAAQDEIDRLEYMAYRYDVLATEANQWEGNEADVARFRGYADNYRTQAPALGAAGGQTPAGGASDMDVVKEVRKDPELMLRDDMIEKTLREDKKVTDPAERRRIRAAFWRSELQARKR